MLDNISNIFYSNDDTASNAWVITRLLLAKCVGTNAIFTEITSSLFTLWEGRGDIVSESTNGHCINS